MLPPYHQNPFGLYPIDKLKDTAEESAAGKVLTPEQEAAFFRACGERDRPVFATLAAYGLWVAELTHLLIEDVDAVGAADRQREVGDRDRGQ
jgi:hypothetical protein